MKKKGFKNPHKPQGIDVKIILLCMQVQPGIQTGLWGQK